MMQKDLKIHMKSDISLPFADKMDSSFECENFNNYIIVEGMTSISAVINGIRTGVNQRKILHVLIDNQKVKSKQKELHFLNAVRSEFCFDIIFVATESIARMTSGNTHGGIVALCSDRPLPLLNECMNKQPWNLPHGYFVLLEGVEDPYNFGYILRSLYAAGVDGVILPARNWMSATDVVARASAGASELLPMAVSDSATAVCLFKKQGYRIICAGIRDSVSSTEANLKHPLLLVIGGEKRGISRAVLDQADQIVRIDYGRDFRGSLCASSAAAVLAFEVLRQNKTLT